MLSLRSSWETRQPESMTATETAPAPWRTRSSGCPRLYTNRAIRDTTPDWHRDRQRRRWSRPDRQLPPRQQPIAKKSGGRKRTRPAPSKRSPDRFQQDSRRNWVARSAPVLEGAQDPGHGDRGVNLDLDKSGGDVLAGDILCPRDFQTLEHGIDVVQVR